ncbi:MAG: hypothetical protein PUD64_10440 [Bacteroidales bacterium]|nr:hypothetical protein [Bacteroidales bacterium]
MRPNFLLIFLFFFTSVLSAQNQIATLNHNGNITTEYGANALISLHEKAVEGDIITLSAGSFNSPGYFDKLITIRGVGFNVNSSAEGYYEPTIIDKWSSVTINEYVLNQNLTIEGIVFNEVVRVDNSKNVQLNKCKFKQLDLIEVSNCYIMHSVIEGLYSFGSAYPKFINCVVRNFNDDYNNAGNKPRDVFFLNSIIETDHNFGWGDRFQNCIIVYTGNDSANFQNRSNAYNLFVGGNSSNPCPNSDEWHPNYILPEGVKAFQENTFYFLTEDAKIYHDTDGSELGIYGGSYPFSATPSNPQIKKFQVAPKTTADGKLSVDIEISMPN